MKRRLIPILCIAIFASCSGEEKKNSSVKELRAQDAKTITERAEALPEVTGKLALQFGDDSVNGDAFDKTGCNLIFASTKKQISINVIGSGDDEGKRLVISFPHPQDGSKPLAGNYSTTDGVRFAANGYFDAVPGAVSLKDGSLTISACDKETGKVSLKFEGKGGSIGQATGDLPAFSGTFEAENLQVVRY